jgi:hypothetical protein
MLKVYSENSTNRLLYAIDLVFNQVGGIAYEFTNDLDSLSKEDHVINYSGKQIEGAFQVHPHGLLFEKNIDVQDVPFDYRSDSFLVSLFPTEFDDLGFDVFAASFYLASRYEEYRKFEADEHGRYPAKLSLQHKIGILRRPIINIWVEGLKQQLSEKWGLPFPSKYTFSIVNTIDVDVAFAYKAKGAIRGTGGLGKDLMKADFSSAKQRLGTLANKERDPLDTYDYIQEMVEKHKVESIFFLLLGDYKKPYDTANDYTAPAYKELVSQLSNFSKMGLHPSYNAYLSKGKLKKEMDRLQSLVKIDEVIARKHFLRLSVPDTYRLMEEVGISDDYTMGYADQVGFRAGLCTPFQVFDILQDKPLGITVHPFAYMDGTLCEYLNLTTEEAIEQISFLKQEVQKVGGEFIGIWHNTSLTDEGEWKGWRAVYETGLSKS